MARERKGCVKEREDNSIWARVTYVGDDGKRRELRRRAETRTHAREIIRQFIDKRPRFYFVSEGEAVEDSIPFDMFGAGFTHQGEDCTLETLIKRFGLTDDRA